MTAGSGARPDQSGHGVQPGVVLLVEDDVDLLEYVSVVLEDRAGLEVVTAQSAEEALRALTTSPVDALVTDIHMSGMTGLELARAVRKLQPALPILMMTAHATVESAIEALRHQVDEFLVKPIGWQDLVGKVVPLAEKGRRAREQATIQQGASAAVAGLRVAPDHELAELTDGRTSIHDQLQRAAQVQRDLLPRSAPPAEGYALAAMCLPSYAVGGDFYDWYRADGAVDFTVADVMGKGIPAAIVTSAVRAVLRGVPRTGGPAAALAAAAQTLLLDLEDTTTFVTVVHGSLELATGEVRFVDAGHGLAALIHPDGTFERHSGLGLPLGVPGPQSWEEQRVTLSPGDTFLVFSDGLLDLLGGDLESLGDLAHLVAGATDPDDVLDRVRDLAGDAVLTDDVTVAVLHRKALDSGPQVLESPSSEVGVVRSDPAN